MKRKILASAVVILGLVGLSAVSAQDKVPFSRNQPIIYVGASAEAGGNMLLRDSAPQNTALWYTKGKEIGVLEAGEKVRIQDIKKIPSLLGNQWWVKVERLDASVGPETGWVYYGGTEYLALKELPVDRTKIENGAGIPQ